MLTQADLYLAYRTGAAVALISAGHPVTEADVRADELLQELRGWVADDIARLKLLQHPLIQLALPSLVGLLRREVEGS
jgi:hypothetical protein